MKKIKIYILIILAAVSSPNFAQQVNININAVPASIEKDKTGYIEVSICNVDISPIAVPANKLRPLISVPGNVTITGVTDVNGNALTGFTVLSLSSGTGNAIRLLATNPLQNFECFDFRVTVLAVNVGPTDVVTGTLGFAGPPPTNDVPGDNNSTSGIAVTPPIATPPVATNDTQTTPAGTPVTVTTLSNDTPGSAAIDPTSVKLTDPVSGLPVSSVMVPGQGTYTVNPATGDVTFTPVAGFTGPSTPVSYTVKDINGVTSNPATISITVTPTPPTAVPDPKTTPFNTPVTITTISNDIPGSSPIDPTSVLIIDPADNTPKTSVTIPGEGTYVVNTTTGDITFTPVPTFTGTGTPVSYTEKDVNGVISNPAPITVTVGPPTPPTAVPDPKTTPFNTPVTITTISNDIPGSSPIDPTSVLIIDPADNTPKTSVTIPGEGTYVVNTTTGDITFTPVATFTGTATPVNYTEKDVNGVISNPAPITVTVTATPPVAKTDIGTSTNGNPAIVTVLTNDTPGSAPIDPTT
ncbi:Ig-like domain-containing protein, partial [Dyadobacter frigoris]